MNNKYLRIKKFLICIWIFLFSNTIFALNGREIIENADQYLTWRWYCNDWNARTTNADVIYENNDWKYPFFPAGERIKKNPDGTYETSDGWHTGIAYGWGRVINYQLKIVNYQLRDVLIEN